MNVFQCLIPADPSQHKENAKGEVYLFQLPLLSNKQGILSSEQCHFGFTPPQMRSEAQLHVLISDGKDSNNRTTNTNILRSSSVRSRKEEPFPGAKVSLILMYAETTLHILNKMGFSRK